MEKKTKIETVKFPKEKLLKSKMFENRKDALAVVIKDGEEISVEEANARLDKFMKRKVK